MELIPLSPLVSLLAVLAEPLAGALAIIVGCTTLGGGLAHYGAVLMGKSKLAVERTTAFGFFIGAAIGVAATLLALFY
jgi:hypothetical protein